MISHGHKIAPIKKEGEIPLITWEWIQCED